MDLLGVVDLLKAERYQKFSFKLLQRCSVEVNDKLYSGLL